MPIFANSTGTAIVYDSYRTTLPYEGYFALTSQLIEIAQKHGQFLHLEKHTDHNNSIVIDVAASHEEGYLLGEWVASVYPDENLIYSEQIQSDGTCLVVCICNRKVILESIVCPGIVSDEILISLYSTRSLFKVVVAGLEPAFDWVQRDNSATIPADLIETSERLDHGFLAGGKTPHKALQLRPLKRAVTQAKLQPFSAARLGAAAALIAATALGFSYLSDRSADNATPVERVDPYKDYRTALDTRSPAGNVLATIHMLAISSLAPGWKPLEVGISPTNTYAEMNSTGGSVTDLSRFADEHQLVIRNKKDSIFLYGRAVTIPRKFPDRIYSIKDVTTHINDILQVTYDSTFSTNDLIVSGKVFRREGTITMKRAVYDDMTMVAEALTDLPVVLDSVVIKPTGQSFEMTIKLMIYGAVKRS